MARCRVSFSDPEGIAHAWKCRPIPFMRQSHSRLRSFVSTPSLIPCPYHGILSSPFTGLRLSIGFASAKF